jgi:hypothetical protein
MAAGHRRHVLPGTTSCLGTPLSLPQDVAGARFRSVKIQPGRSLADGTASGSVWRHRQSSLANSEDGNSRRRQRDHDFVQAGRRHRRHRQRQLAKDLLGETRKRALPPPWETCSRRDRSVALTQFTAKKPTLDNGSPPLASPLGAGDCKGWQRQSSRLAPREARRTCCAAR